MDVRDWHNWSPTPTQPGVIRRVPAEAPCPRGHCQTGATSIRDALKRQMHGKVKGIRKTEWLTGGPDSEVFLAIAGTIRKRLGDLVIILCLQNSWISKNTLAMLKISTFGGNSGAFANCVVKSRQKPFWVAFSLALDGRLAPVLGHSYPLVPQQTGEKQPGSKNVLVSQCHRQQRIIFANPVVVASATYALHE